jgi:hypothetical protein
MSFKMGPHISALRESLLAVRALIWLLASVSSDVNLECA